ncbi:MAG: transglycosylase domain-containing protein [Luteolibacter sp.]|uniref:transglycosylase domain-containing protein n=1 Tax=Luteolibacter sp. TaxID=1962973 RepID=UPI003264ACB2
MPKRNPPDDDRLRDRNAPHRAPSRGPGAASLLFFWPFHLVNLLTRPLGSPLKFLVRIFAYPVVAGLYPLLVFAVVYGIRAQQYDLAKIHAMPERTIIHDRLGEEIGRIHGEKRSIVPLNQVAENFRKAILARENERFYNYGAVDPVGIGRAVLKNLQGKKEGASTITQQLASDIFKLKDPEKIDEIRSNKPRLLMMQIDRKCLEIAIAFRLESAMTKDEILEAYINQINWGRSINGVGEASRIYFEKHPSELTLSESALLAGIVRGPDAYNPFSSMEAATRERGTTLDRMVDAGVITKAEAEAAKLEPIEVRPKWRREAKQSYAMEAIQRDLEVILEKENIELGGLDITTTIDLRIQHKGEEALDKKLREVERMSGYDHQTQAAWRQIPADQRKEPDYIQGAAVVVENRTGAVLAVIGGRDANESIFNRATRASRQVGSLFKPFIYLAAFDQGLRPDTNISDGPIETGEIKGAGNWHPHNSDGKFGGMQPVSYGLIRSRNTMSVRVGNYAGIPKVKEVTRMAGFTTPMPDKPTSFLGTWGASPWEIATAYTIFPNEGIRYRPYLISEIKDRDGNILWPSKDDKGHPISPTLSYPAAKAGSAWSVSRILKEVATSGTASSIKRLGFDKPCGGKTGTTNDFKDAWFSGFTSNLTCAVWVGFDQPKKTFQGGYGATLSLPVWVDIMKTADRLGYKAGELNANVKLVEMELCRLSGKRATAGCREADTAYTDKVPVDIALPENDLCPIHPAKAQAVDESSLNAPEPPPLKAQPVADPEKPLRAVPVE